MLMMPKRPSRFYRQLLVGRRWQLWGSGRIWKLEVAQEKFQKTVMPMSHYPTQSDRPWQCFDVLLWFRRWIIMIHGAPLHRAFLGQRLPKGSRQGNCYNGRKSAQIATQEFL